LLDLQSAERRLKKFHEDLLKSANGMKCRLNARRSAQKYCVVTKALFAMLEAREGGAS
jgi:hypothetical protein